MEKRTDLNDFGPRIVGQRDELPALGPTRTDIEYPICAKCNRPYRKWGWKKKDHPGTLAKGIHPHCNVCTERIRKGASINVRNQDAKMLSAVERYLSMRTPTLRELFEGSHKVREDLAIAALKRHGKEDLIDTIIG